MQDAEADTPLRDPDPVGAAVLVSVQHELRTPLTVLGVTNETLLGLVDDPAVRGLLEAQERAIERLTALVEGVLDVTKLVTEHARTDPQARVDVRAEVGEVARELAERNPDAVVVSDACEGAAAVTVAPLFRLLLRCVVEDQLAFGRGAAVEVGAQRLEGELRMWARSTAPVRHLGEAVTYSPHGGNGLHVLAACFLAERLGGGVELPTDERDELLLWLPQRRAADLLD